MASREDLFWVWLAEAMGAASGEFFPLIELYQNPYDIFLAEESELERIPFLSERSRAVLADKSLAHATDVLALCERHGIDIVTYGDEAYPKGLREIPRPPVLLYCIGTLPDFHTALGVGMVGTRRMSAYGMKSAYKIGYELADAGAVVVSGMAAGIDGVCAAAALKAGGTTVAVLGCGLDTVYPKHHEPLFREICKRGAVISEYPPGTAPRHYHFPVRNRLISGMTEATVVVEAGLGSGSLITAREAVTQGKPVFAVPANVGSEGAEGTNGLLRDGARLAAEAGDILEVFRFAFSSTLKPDNLSTAAERSGLDQAYLASMGVIELVPKAESAGEAKFTLPAKAKRAAAKAPRTRTEREVPKPAPVKAAADPDATAQPQRQNQTPDAVLGSLSRLQREILSQIPDDRAVSTDALSGLDASFGDIIAALTMLEILGLLQKLPGGLYIKS